MCVLFPLRFEGRVVYFPGWGVGENMTGIGLIGRRALLAALLVIVPPAVGAGTPDGVDLLTLPVRIDTKVPAFLEERLADIEKVASALPQMDRKKAYLITLPLQNYLEDVVLSDNRPAILYPRAIAWVIGQQAALGTSKKEIARLLVTYYQRDAYSAMHVNDPAHGVSEATGGRQE